MKVRNFVTGPRRVGASRHGGAGVIEQSVLYIGDDLVSCMSIVAFDRLPPGSSIALHPHKSEEEIYIVLRGQGMLETADGQDLVTEGDVILTSPGDAHGLRNIGDDQLDIVVVEAHA
jgi:uncharacterized cupin superfamily protein